MAEGMMTLLLLLANIVQDATSGVDSLSGHAGWFGAGLLGAVLSWLLLVHLPSKDKQLKDFIESKDRQMEVKDAQINKQMETKDAQIMTVLTQKWESIQILSVNYQTSLKEIVAHCEKEMRDITVEWKEDIDRLISKLPPRSN